MACPPQPASPTDGVGVWQRYQWVWHLLAAAVLVLVAVLTVAEAAGTRTTRLVTLATLAFLGIWYATVGQRAIRQRGWFVVYFTGVAVAFPIVVWLRQDGSLLLCYLVPQAFVMCDRVRHGIAVTTLLQGTMAVVVVVRESLTGWAAVNMVGIVLLSIALSSLLGVFIHRIIDQSQQRAALIAELERTREELAAERHEAGVRAERERLAAEIHDTLAQGFTSILMLTQAARAALPRDPDAAGHQLDVIEQTARESLAETRSLVAALAPVELASGSLPDALRRLAARYRRDTGLTVEVTVTGRAAGPMPDRDVVLLRAAQEALHNIRKYAGARAVALTLSYEPTSRVLRITDDGRGFAPDQPHTGYGLRAMRQRVEACGGTLAVRSTPQTGTTVEICLPEGTP